jgi:hypothetical protein
MVMLNLINIIPCQIQHLQIFNGSERRCCKVFKNQHQEENLKSFPESNIKINKLRNIYRELSNLITNLVFRLLYR